MFLVQPYSCFGRPCNNPRLRCSVCQEKQPVAGAVTIQKDVRELTLLFFPGRWRCREWHFVVNSDDKIDIRRATESDTCRNISPNS